MSPVLALGANNAILDTDVLSQTLLNYSPENYTVFLVIKNMKMK
jgi:hypothetical protein